MMDGQSSYLDSAATDRLTIGRFQLETQENEKTHNDTSCNGATTHSTTPSVPDHMMDGSRDRAAR